MAKRILLIDDDRIVIRSVEKYLSSCGYTVETASSGQEALLRTEKTDFDLIISDIRMPGMDGIETLKKMRQGSGSRNREKPPAIIITGYAGAQEVQRNAAELGIIACIYKPFELEEFIRAVKSSLETRPEAERERLPIEGGLPQEKQEPSAGRDAIREEFIALTGEFKAFLERIKTECDAFDTGNKNEQKQIEFIRQSKKEIFKKLDDYFNRAWDMVTAMGRDRYSECQNYFQQTLGRVLLEQVETNRHVYRKPLGYPGDYIMMTYIYDYHGDIYLGESTFEKFMNNYTCTIPISHSNIERKEYLKKKIIETVEGAVRPKILSVACGPAREFIELLHAGKITRPLTFKFLDFEKRALEHIEHEVKKICGSQENVFSLEYICRDVTSLIRDKGLKDSLSGCDLVYAFGIYDYLNDRMAARLTNELFQLVRHNGTLVICNISLEHSSHRAYYELLGEWNMVHRTKEQVLSLTKDIAAVSDIEFEQPNESTKYYFLRIKKNV